MARPKGWKRPEPIAGPLDAPKKASAYPWASIGVGQSFFVTNPETAKAGCRQHGARLDRTFTWALARETVDGMAYNGARVTRVS